MANHDGRELLFVLCECSSPDHQLIFSLDTDPQWVECWANVHLAKLSFFKRLYHGIRYIFGFRCRYGDFQEVLIPRKKAKELRDFLSKYIDAEEKKYEV